MFEKWGIVALAALGLVCVFLFNYWFQRNFEERIIRDELLRAANHASDTSTEYMLYNSEETSTGLIIIDPEWVWYVYKYTFLEAIGLNSRKNIVELDHFFPSTIIAVNDGYYMRTSTVNEAGEWEYRFGQKIPFARNPTVQTNTYGFVPDTVQANSPPASVATVDGMNPIIPRSTSAFPVAVADTMNGKNINVFYPNWNNSDTDFYGGSKGRWVRYAVDGRQLESIAGTAHDKPAIARELLRGIDALMRWNANSNSVYRQGGELRIPAEIITNFNSENVTFVGPMVIAIADNFTWIGNRAMSFWTLSNTQIVASPRIYVYAYSWINTVTKQVVNNVTGNPPSATWIPNYMYSLCNPHGTDMYQQNMALAGRVFIRNPAATTGDPNIYVHQIFNSEEAAAVYGAYPDVEYAQLCS